LEGIKLAEESKKLSAEAEKLGQDAKLSGKQFNVDRWVKVAQAVTPLGLLLTIMLQAFQIWSTQRTQALTEERNAWREGIKVFMSTKDASSSAVQAFFQSTLNSPTFGAISREVLLQQLPHFDSTSHFRKSFAVLFPEEHLSDLDDLVALSRELAILDEESS